MPYLKYNENLKVLSRQLRGNLTDAEKLLWSKMRGGQIKNYQFFRQRPIDKYIVDFYCKEAGLVIEIDGGQHYEEENIEKDKIRDKTLKELGLRVVRFTNLEVLKNINGVLKRIYDEIGERI